MGSARSATTEQLLCLGFAFWNGEDPILKERIFGLTGSQGNHGEDAKEYWWYLDCTPSHSWMRWRYAYPQAAFPYAGPDRGQNARRSRERARVRAARHRRVRARLVGHRRSTTPRPTPSDICVLRQRPQRRRAARDAAAAADAVVPQPLVMGLRARSSRRSPLRVPLSCRPRTRSSARSCSPATANRSRCSATTRPTPNGCGASRAGVPEGRDQRSRRVRRGDRQPGADRNQGGAALRADGRAGRNRRGAAAAGPARRRGRRPARHDRDGPRRRGGRLLRLDRPRRDRRRASGDAPGVRRDAVVQAVLPLRRAALAGR